MSQPAEEPTVAVTVEVEQETPAPEPEDTAPEVVVVETGGDDAPTEVLVENAITTEGRLTNIENQLALLVGAQMEQQAATAAVAEQAEIAEDAAEMAVEIAVEAAEGEQAEPDEDSEPEREHGFFRTWFGK